MTSPVQRAARQALDDIRPAFDRLNRATDSAEISARLVEAWAGAETALRALAGGATQSGQALVRELRTRGLLGLDEAHALIDFHAAAERAHTADYTPNAADVAVARDAYDRMVDLVDRSGPAPAGSSAAPHVTTGADDIAPVVTPVARRPNMLGRILVAVALVAVVGAGAFFAINRSGEPSELRQGRNAFAAGDRLGARAAFAAAMREYPELAQPHIYVGRMAREEGDMATANIALRRAVELEPQNPLAHRELAALLLATNQLELARSFYERAIRLDPNDRNALGFMGCTLARQGRFDLAPRFLQRAGAGSWQLCAQQAMQPPPPPPPQ